MTDPMLPPAQEPPDQAGMPVNGPGSKPVRRPLLGLAIVVLLAGGVGLFIAFGSSHAGRGGSRDTPPAPVQHTVTYKVEGSDGATGASITMQIPGGGTSQQDVGLPLRHKDGTPLTFDASAGDFVYISAQNSQDSGQITCTIEVDGQELQTATSVGAYVIATCSGRV